jgi:hypothetical protein
VVALVGEAMGSSSIPDRYQVARSQRHRSPARCRGLPHLVTEIAWRSRLDTWPVFVVC